MGKRKSRKKKALTHLRALDNLIETERCRLHHAEAILMCLSAALDDPDDSRPILYNAAVDAACNLVAEAVNQLDSVNRARVLAGKTETEVD